MGHGCEEADRGSTQGVDVGCAQGTPVSDAVSRLLKNADLTTIPDPLMMLEPLITVRIAEDKWLTWADTSKLHEDAHLERGETYNVSYPLKISEAWFALPVIDNVDIFEEDIEELTNEIKRRLYRG